MAYLALPMTPTRETGRWARSAHSIDGNFRYGAIEELASLYSSAAAAWPTANLIIYVPILVKTAVVAKKLWYIGGATGTGNYDIGIYSRAGARLINSGSQAKGTNTDETVFDITDTPLQPGLYYLALQASNNTDTYSRFNPAAPIAATQGYRSEAAGGFGLPTTATWVVANTLAYIPPLGLLAEGTVA